MKCGVLLLMLIAFNIYHLNCFTKNDNWRATILTYNKMNLKLVYYKNINISGVGSILKIIDLSMLSKKPISLFKQASYSGLIGNNDLICISKSIIYWFSATSTAKGRQIGSGGGALAGMWRISLFKKKSPVLTNYNKISGYSKNLLLTHKHLTKNVGLDISGDYADSDVQWGLTYSETVDVSNNTGEDISELDKGFYADDDGTVVQFKGIITNSKSAAGFLSKTDTDPRPAKAGLASYLLTYRIPAEKTEFMQEIHIKAEQNNFGPISNAFVKVHLPKHKSKHIIYASNMRLKSNNEEFDSERYKINRYFKNSCVKKILFYKTINKRNTNKQIILQGTMGKAKLACIGKKGKKKNRFFCVYPNNDYIPKKHVKENVLKIVDNQNINNNGNYITMQYQLFSDNKKSLTINQGDSLVLITRFKFMEFSKNHLK